METADIDFVAIAPEGKEVEELGKKEIYKALREKTPAAQFKFDIRRAAPKREARPEVKRMPSRGRELRAPRDRERKPRMFEKRALRLRKEQKDTFKKVLSDLVGTRAACIFDSKDQLLGKVPVSELFNTLRTIESPHTIVFDGKVDQKLNGIAVDKGVKYLVGMEKEDIHSSVTILCKKDLE